MTRDRPAVAVTLQWQPDVAICLQNEFPLITSKTRPKPSQSVKSVESVKSVKSVKSLKPMEPMELIDPAKPPLKHRKVEVIPGYQDMVLTVLRNHQYVYNFWSCHNEDLFDFPRDYPIVISVQVYVFPG